MKRPLIESNPVPSLRRRLQKSPTLAAVVAWIVGAYLRFCRATTKWSVIGDTELHRDLADGPILFAMWHDRILMAAYDWPMAHGQLSTLHAGSSIGRLAGTLHTQIGLRPMKMSDGKSNIAASRQVLQRMRDGVSIGVAVDGPDGPVHVVKDAALDWARTMQRPIYTYAFTSTRHRRLNAWDRMYIPLPFGRGAVVFHKWDAVVPRKPDAKTLEALRTSFGVALTAAGQKADDALK